MALTNAEKQAHWRQRHAKERRVIARIANLLIRRAKSEGRTVGAKVGWNDVVFDQYFYTLADLLSDTLKTDSAIKQLRWALAKCLQDRRNAREYLREHPGMRIETYREMLRCRCCFPMRPFVPRAPVPSPMRAAEIKRTSGGTRGALGAF
jgi:hypothetical protein